jgi:hypothetical protein
VEAKLPRSPRFAGFACALASLFAAHAGAEPAARAPLPPAYVEECGSCHAAFPARFLGRPSWDAVLAGLDRHFGVDASLEAPVLDGIRAYLEAGARRRDTSAAGEPLLRITEAAWFRHEHPRPSARVWKLPEVRSPANCAACHREAETGDYRERSLHVPKQGATQ